jgi:hypothetical protein
MGIRKKMESRLYWNHVSELVQYVKDYSIQLGVDIDCL